MSGMQIKLGHYWDNSWRMWLAPARESLEAAGVEEPVAILAESEVVAICRAHFDTFGSLSMAAAHYGLTDGRLAQIQCGIHVGCPRILSALGIKRERGGVYRRIGEPDLQVPGEPVSAAPRKPARVRPKAGGAERKSQVDIVNGVKLAEHRQEHSEPDPLVSPTERVDEPAYLQGLTFGGASGGRHGKGRI